MKEKQNSQWSLIILIRDNIHLSILLLKVEAPSSNTLSAVLWGSHSQFHRRKVAGYKNEIEIEMMVAGVERQLKLARKEAG